MMKAGLLGRKSNKGFFLYEKGKKDKKINPEAVKILEKYVTKKEDIKTVSHEFSLSSFEAHGSCSSLIDQAHM